MALNALRKLRSMRLPGVLKVLDTFEMDSVLYIVTERVVPLCDVLRAVETADEMLILVTYYVAKAVKFINVEGGSVLGQLSPATVYVTKSGEIRVGGFEVCTNLSSDAQQPLYKSSYALPGFNDYLPPEVNEKGIDSLRGKMALKLDSWRLATFIYTLFHNGDYHFDISELATMKLIPKGLAGQNFSKLISPSPTTRGTVEQYLSRVSTFDHSVLINVYEHLDEFTLKSEDEKIRLFDSLDSVKADALPGFLEYRVIPELAQFFTQAPTQAALSLKYILSYSETLPKIPFDSLVKPIILKAFTIPDRQIRMLLLGFLPKYVENLTKNDISDQMFNSFVTGFSDSNEVIREETIKAVIYIAPKLSDRQLNNELLRYLAKTQSDQKPDIRTTTTILLGKIAEHLNKSSRSTVLATAFGKSLKDPHLQSRLAGLLALCTCLDYFTPDVIANKILTVIAPSLLDRSSRVRDEAQKAFDMFFNKIKEEASKLPVDADEADDTVEQVASNVQNFGLNLSGAFAKLTTGLGGSLNNDVSNGITPDLSRAGTPKVVETFEQTTFGRGEPSKSNAQQKSYFNDWDNDDIEIDADDDGWGEPVEKPAAGTIKPVVKPVVKPVAKSRAPKVTNLVTEDTKSKPVVKPASKAKGMQLKSKSKLKLDLDLDGQDDGWGDGW